MRNESVTAPGGRDTLIGAMLLGRYRVLRKLGEGGMGAVYEAENVLLERRVAIKCLLPKLSTDPELVARFVREAQAATRIQHPHIVQVLDLDALPDGTRFMVLELLDGHDLDSELQRLGSIALPRMVSIALQVCDALAAAHQAGVVHRDLKPANVFLVNREERDDFVKIVDFGIARLVEHDGPTSLTRTGTLLGTPYYMAPEQVTGQKDIDHRADVYALGVMIYECLTGQPPFEGAGFGQLIVQITQEPAPALRVTRPDCPEALDALVAQMLSKARDDRPASLSAVAAALRSIAGELGRAQATNVLGASGSRTGPLRDPRDAIRAARDDTTARARRPSRWPLGMAVVILGLLLVGLGLATSRLVSRRQHVPPPVASPPAAGLPTEPVAPVAERLTHDPAPEPTPEIAPAVIVAPSDPPLAATPQPTPAPVSTRGRRPGKAAVSRPTPPAAPARPSGGRGLITSFPD